MRHADTNYTQSTYTQHVPGMTYFHINIYPNPKTAFVLNNVYCVAMTQKYFSLCPKGSATRQREANKRPPPMRHLIGHAQRAKVNCFVGTTCMYMCDTRSQCQRARNEVSHLMSRRTTERRPAAASSR